MKINHSNHQTWSTEKRIVWFLMIVSGGISSAVVIVLLVKLIGWIDTLVNAVG